MKKGNLVSIGPGSIFPSGDAPGLDCAIRLISMYSVQIDAFVTRLDLLLANNQINFVLESTAEGASRLKKPTDSGISTAFTTMVNGDELKKAIIELAEVLKGL